MSMLSNLASAAGLTRPKKKFQFDVTFYLQDLRNCTYVTGVLYAKLRLIDGGSYTEMSRRCDLKNHCVRWDQVLEFPCKMYASQSTGELEPCMCKVSIRKEAKGGLSCKKLGYVKINLAEYAGSKEIQRKYLLESYNESKHKPDNSILKVQISLKQTSGDSVFKVPRGRVWDLSETEDEGIQSDIHGPKHSSLVSHQRTSTASSLSEYPLPIGADNLSLSDLRKRSSSDEEHRRSNPGGSLPQINDDESVASTDQEVCTVHSSDSVADETQSTATPRSPPSDNGTVDSQEKTPRNLSPSMKTARSNSLGSGDHNHRPTSEILPPSTGVHSLPNRSNSHRRHTSVSTSANSPHKFHHRRQHSLLSGQSSKSTSAYSTLSERSTGSWCGSQDNDSISGSNRKLTLIPTSSKVEQSRVDPNAVIEKLFEGQTFEPKDSAEGSSKGLQLFVDKTRGTFTVGGSELDRENANLQAVDVSGGSVVHSRSSSGGGSPRPRHKPPTSGGTSSLLAGGSIPNSRNSSSSSLLKPVR